MAEHSKEPWRIDNNDRQGFLIAEDGRVIKYWNHNTRDDPIHTQDAVRIVACVNALAGLKPEKVKAMVEVLAEVVHALNSYHEEHCRQHPAECADDMLIERAEVLLAEVKAT